MNEAVIYVNACDVKWKVLNSHQQGEHSFVTAYIEDLLVEEERLVEHLQPAVGPLRIATLILVKVPELVRDSVLDQLDDVQIYLTPKDLITIRAISLLFFSVPFAG